MENNIICPFNTAKQHRYKNIITSIKLTTNFRPWEWAFNGVCPRSICMSDDNMTAYLKQAALFRSGGLCLGICIILYTFYGLYDMCVRVWGVRSCLYVSSCVMTLTLGLAGWLTVPCSKTGSMSYRHRIHRCTHWDINKIGRFIS